MNILIAIALSVQIHFSPASPDAVKFRNLLFSLQRLTGVIVEWCNVTSMEIEGSDDDKTWVLWGEFFLPERPCTDEQYFLAPNIPYKNARIKTVVNRIEVVYSYPLVQRALIPFAVAP